MKIRIGTFDLADNSATLSVQSRTLWNKGGQPYSSVRTFRVEGTLAADGQAAISAAEDALKAALAKPYQNLLLLHDDGSRASDCLVNEGSVTGVHVTEGPSFTTTRGPEYATLRTYSFTCEAEYPLAGSQLLLLDFRETLVFSGGGPLYAMRRAINGPPQRQLVYPWTEYRVSQHGSATGYRGYPVPQGPKFPLALREAGRIEQKTPRRMGNGYQEYEVTWNYEFESATPLVAAPALWIS